jgi:hypothetical protein
MYIGISAGKFDELRKAGTMPEPRLIGTRKIWDIRDLDRCFDALPYENEQRGTGWDDV